jgi:hypothetical protein
MKTGKIKMDASQGAKKGTKGKLCEQTSRLRVERGVRQHYAVVGQQRHERAYPRPRAAERIDTPG